MEEIVKKYTPPSLGKYKSKMKKSAKESAGITQAGSPSTVGTESVTTSDKVKMAKMKDDYTQKAIAAMSKEKGSSAMVSGQFRSQKAKANKVKAAYEAAKKAGKTQEAKKLGRQYNSMLDSLKTFTAKNVKDIVKSGKIERKYKGKIKRAMDKDDFVRGQ